MTSGGMRHHAGAVKNTCHAILSDYLELIDSWIARGEGGSTTRSTRRFPGSDSGKGPGGSHSRSSHASPSGVPLGRQFDGAGTRNTGRDSSRGKGGGARGDTKQMAGAEGMPELKANDDAGNEAHAVWTAAASDRIDEGTCTSDENKERNNEP